MATNTGTKTRNTTKTRAAAAPKKETTEQEIVVAEEQVKIVPKDVDPHQYIPVKNGFHGSLIYQSKRTGEVFRWDEFGAEQDIELQELRNAKTTSKIFFINNWFMFSDDYKWVIDYLGMQQYYKYALDVDGFDSIFKKTPAEIKKVVKEMSDGQKNSLRYRALDLIASGDIDSRKVIAALEEALGTELIEK